MSEYGFQSARGRFITGVVYVDVDGDKFYIPEAGEAFGGIAITVYQVGT